jgi:DNA-binding response OmpR family regulator
MLTRQQALVSSRKQFDHDLSVERSTGLDTARVLLVEENPEALEALTLLLRTEGAKTLELTDPEQVEHAARLFRPHLVILDIRDGFDVCRKLRATSLGTALRIVSLRALDDAEYEQSVDAAGFDLRLAKPFEPSTAAKMIQSSLQSPRTLRMQ